MIGGGDVKAWIEEIRSMMSTIPGRLFVPIKRNLEDEEEQKKAEADSIAYSSKARNISGYEYN